MDPFVREFQPDRYETWRAGLEVGTHPEDELTKLYSRQRHAAARAAKTPPHQLPVQQAHKYQQCLIFNNIYITLHRNFLKTTRTTR